MEERSKLFLRQIPFFPKRGRAGRGGRPELCVLREGAQKDLGHHLAFPHPVARSGLHVCARNAWCSHVARYACSNTSPPAQEPSVPLLDTRL